MKYKKSVLILLFALTILFTNGTIIYNIHNSLSEKIEITYETLSDRNDDYKLYYNETNIEENYIEEKYDNINKQQELKYLIPKESDKLRIGLGEKPGNIWIKNLKIKYGYKKVFFENKDIINFDKSKSTYQLSENGEWVTINSVENNPYFIIDLSKTLDVNRIKAINTMIKIIILLLINSIFVIMFIFRSKFMSIFREAYNNRFLVWNLSLNDFKTKYAGSYLGIFWAFVQPVVTTLIYWFVFDFGFKAAPASMDTPFILWLIAGIVPWFYFSESVMNATNSLLEYSYLVKKVLFKISILPIVKVISSFFIHIFFVCLITIIFILYRHYPTIYFIQTIYYMICTSILVLALSYISCSIIIFFKDLGQIINVVLQIGMWLTPIMWNQNMLSEKYHWILKLNPIYYIVEGYRDCYINKIWFWEKYMQTTYFWIITIVTFYIGVTIFRKLKNHFADVL